MDPMGLLNIERRTGIKEDDIEAFLERANAVEQAIKGMVSGSVDPATVKIPGLESDEEKAQMEAERQKRLEESRRKAEELRLKRKQEERERWWAGAELLISHSGQDGKNDDDDDDDAENSAPRVLKEKQALVMQRYTADYSRWNEWTPSDPATLQEEAEAKADEERKKNEEFEKNNAEFCEQFLGDIKERNKSVQKKRDEAEALRNKGNRHFKKKEYVPHALEAYMESLKLQPYDTKTLTNIAQVSIKTGQLDDALDFLGRTLALEPGHVKALSRQAFVLGEQKNFDAALKSIAKAVKRDANNEDLLSQRRELEIMAKEFQDEAALRSMMAPLPPPPAAPASEQAPAPAPAPASAPSSEIGVPMTPPPPEQQPAAPAASSAVREFQSGVQAAMLDDFALADSLLAALSTVSVPPAGFGAGAADATPATPATRRLAELLQSLASRMPKVAAPANRRTAFDELVQRVGANAMIKVHARTSGLLSKAVDFCVAVAVLLEAEQGAGLEKEADQDLLTSCLHFVTIAVDGERAAKLLLVEHAATLPAVRSLVGCCVSLPEVVLAAANLLHTCCADDLSKKTQLAVLSDRKLVPALAAALGEIVSRSRPVRFSDLVSAAAATSASASASATPAGRDSEAQTLSICKASIAIAALIKEVSFSEPGKAAIASPEVGAAVCALGSMLLAYSSSVLWDAHSAIEAALEALLGLSQVEVLRGFFALPAPMGPQEPPAAATGAASSSSGGGGGGGENVMSVVEVVLQRVLSRPGGPAVYTSTCLAVLMNACLDTDGSVRAAVVKHGGMQEALKGLRLGLDSASASASASSSSSSAATAAAAATKGEVSSPLLLSRQAGLMSRLATVEGVQTVLYEPDNYRLICKGIAAAADAEGTAHLVRTLAALNQPPAACRAVALQEQLAPALLALFPRPREELGEITPQSVVLLPAAPASHVLLGNAARCLMPYADDAEHAALLYRRRNLAGIEKLVNAMATCSDMRVRKNVAILLAKGCRLEGVRDLLTHFRGMQMLTELQDKLVK